MTRINARELSGTEGPFGLGLTITRPSDVPEGSVVSILRVPPEAKGMRLDRFVQSQMKRTSRTRAQKIIANGAYSIDARRLKGNDRVHAEQLVLLWRAPWDEQAPDVTLSLLYEDEHLLAVDKPAGIPVHPTARYHKSTVVKLLESARDGERLMLSHRLDRETSGVLLLARTSAADRHIKVQFAQGAATVDKSEKRSVHKEYLAITWGAPDEDRFRIALPLELDPTSSYAVKMRVAEPGRGLPSATQFEVLGRRTNRATGRTYALVRCILETGRQHQIRVHLAANGWPVLGDKLYGPDDGLFGRGADGELTEEDAVVLELPRHALHAAVLELNHPDKPEQRLRIEAPLPDDMKNFWDELSV